VPDTPDVAVLRAQLLLAQGRYAEAEQHHRDSLAIEERMGNQAGIAASYHQIGGMAERQGKFAQAEQYYRASLVINEEVGDRINFATTTSQLGALMTKQNRPAQGVPHNALALLLRADMGIDFALDIYWLSRQRAMLGDGVFERVLLSHVPDAYAAQVLAATAPRAETEEP